jgi:predicted Zn-dependent peptidase
MKDYEVFQFANGIRLVHKQVPHTKIAHCGFILDMGSRDEKPHQQGLAHFWEHMAFKGTTHRKSFHILSRLDRVGGELNAYTTKEKVCFYASFLETHFKTAAELLTDITFNSTFPEKEIEKERQVILEEMSMYRDAPDDAIADDFDALLFSGHTLGNNILGTQESVKGFQRQDFFDFLKENKDTSRIVFSVVGNMTLAQVLKIVRPMIEGIPKLSGLVNRTPYSLFEPKFVTEKKPIQQAHCVLGGLAPAIKDVNRLPYFLLVNLLGGPAMNSRLNLGIREKYGYVYGIDASYAPFVDTGMLSIYFGTEHKQLNRCIDLVKKELRLLRTKTLGTSQLSQAKEQLMGQLAMAEESNMSLMLMLGKSLLDNEKIESLSEIFDHIKGYSATFLQEVAHQYLNDEQFSILTFVPE